MYVRSTSCFTNRVREVAHVRKYLMTCFIVLTSKSSLFPPQEFLAVAHSKTTTTKTTINNTAAPIQITVIRLIETERINTYLLVSDITTIICQNVHFQSISVAWFNCFLNCKIFYNHTTVEYCVATICR